MEYRKFLWVELIAFDNRQPDMGVKDYLDALGFVPDAVSIFMWGSDFLHQHDGMAEDRPFPPDVGAYMDMRYSKPKHDGPPWTKYQLRRAVREFHRYGAQVFFSIFPTSLNGKFHDEWALKHPEAACVFVKGEEWNEPVINPLRRLADGSWYEDFAIEKACEALADYDLDGWHLADGYNHPWKQLCHADYSDDMVDQFLADTGLELPPGHPRVAAGDRDAEDARARFIWKHRRRDWIDFYCRRQEVYFGKIVNRLHAMGKKAVANTCWTRDPVESIYRYGVDCRRLAEIGVDWLVIETVSAGGEMLDQVCRARFSAPFFHVLQSTALLTTAYAAPARFLFTNAAQDITEGWSCLRHAPAFLEREIYSYSNLHRVNARGALEKCFEGLQVCLAAGIEAHEWRWMRERWLSGFATRALASTGLTLVWNDASVRAELDYYLKTRKSLTANLLYRLLAAGLDVATVARLEDLDAVKAPLLALNPGLWPEADARRLAAYDRAPMLWLGALPPEGDRKAETRLCDIVGREPAELRLYGYRGEEPPGLPAPRGEEMPPDLDDIPEPHSFFDEQFYREVSAEFYCLAARLGNRAAGAEISVVHTEWRPGSAAALPLAEANDFRIRGLLLEDGATWRYFAQNDNFRYINCDLAARRAVASAVPVNKFRGRPIEPAPRGGGEAGSRFSLRIPPKGIGVFDIRFEEGE